MMRNERICKADTNTAQKQKWSAVGSRSTRRPKAVYVLMPTSALLSPRSQGQAPLKTLFTIDCVNLILHFTVAEIRVSGHSLAAQWLGLCGFTAEGAGSIPGPAAKIPQARRHSQKKKRKKEMEVLGGRRMTCSWSESETRANPDFHPNTTIYVFWSNLY